MSTRAHIIIDGYNFILRTQRVNRKNENALEIARAQLLAKLLSYKNLKNVNISVVFDGQAEFKNQHPSRPMGINVVFSSPPQNADRVIVNMIEAAQHPANLLIVSSDNFIRTSAGSAGCQILSSNEFSQKLNISPSQDYNEKYATKMSESDLAEWLDIFNKGKKEE
jgi:predicted RNA-binding protein with PIN domain